MLDSRWFLFISFGCITHKSVTVSIQKRYAIGEMNEADGIVFAECVRTVAVVAVKMDFWQNRDIGGWFWTVPEPSSSPACLER